MLTRMVFTVEEEQFALLEGILALHVPYGWEEGAGHNGQAACIVHLTHPGFAAELKATVEQFLPEAVVTIEEVEEVNWVEAWKEFFTPVDGGSHFLVVAPWMEKEQAATKRIPIIIEPKMAFGTGHHATTALCLQAISQLYDDNVIAPGMRFFDLGTGSGILGLASAQLGLRGEGVDIDGPSIANAEENRVINGIAPDALALSLGGLELAQGSYHLITANILAEPLCFMAPGIVKHLATDQSFGLLPPLPRERTLGALILSGLLQTQADRVEAVYTALGLPPARRMTQGEWAALIFYQ